MFFFSRLLKMKTFSVKFLGFNCFEKRRAALGSLGFIETTGSNLRNGSGVLSYLVFDLLVHWKKGSVEFQ